jgi:hypothetical protein
MTTLFKPVAQPKVIEEAFTADQHQRMLEVVRSNSLVSSTVPYGSRRGPRPGNPLPNPHGHPPTPNDHPAQRGPWGFQQPHSNFNPTAGQFLPGTNGFYPPPDAVPHHPLPSGLITPYFHPLVYPPLLMPPPMQPPMLMQPPNVSPYMVNDRTTEQRGRFPLLDICARMQPQDDLPCIVDGRTPEQRRRSPLPDIRAPLPPRNQARDLNPTQQLVAPPQSNGTHRPPHRLGMAEEPRGYGNPAQAVTMPSWMATAAVPPPTTERESRPTEHSLSLDPILDVRGGDECAIASSSCSERGEDANDANDECAIASSSGSDRRGDVDDADDESSGKDP